jgi:lipoate-protein ligase A
MTPSDRDYGHPGRCASTGQLEFVTFFTSIHHGGMDSHRRISSRRTYNASMPAEPDDTWRLIVSQPSRGPLNMALDEAILEAVSAGKSPPTLRLYAWSPPCLSLGVAQPAADVDLEALTQAGWDIVRRPTGGRAILHTDELTYAVIAGSHNRHVAGDILTSYRHLSQALLAALSELGLTTQTVPGDNSDPGPSGYPVCFENPSAYEITAGGKKLIGSAQVRRKHGVLQHGTLPLQGDLGRICRALHFNSVDEREAAVERVRDRATTVESVLGHGPDWETVAEAFKRGFEGALGLVFERGEASAAERRRAKALIEERYGDEAWTFRV